MAITIPSTTLTVLKASLANATHSWACLSVFETSSFVGEEIQVTRTYQLRSTNRSMTIGIIIRLLSGVLVEITVSWFGQTWTTTDAGLRTQIEALAATVPATRAAQLEALLA